MGDDAKRNKAIADAKASLKEIMDGFPDPEEELVEIWDLDRTDNGRHSRRFPDPDAAHDLLDVFRQHILRADR